MHAGSKATRTHIEVDNDPRFAAALGALLEQSAERMGWSPEALSKLHDAVQETWRQIWRSLNGASEKLHVDFDELEDRVEMTFQCAGASAKDLQACVKELGPKLDHVSLDENAGKQVLKLVKNIPRK